MHTISYRLVTNERDTTEERPEVPSVSANSSTIAGFSNSRNSSAQRKMMDSSWSSKYKFLFCIIRKKKKGEYIGCFIWESYLNKCIYKSGFGSIVTAHECIAYMWNNPWKIYWSWTKVFLYISNSFNYNSTDKRATFQSPRIKNAIHFYYLLN